MYRPNRPLKHSRLRFESLEDRRLLSITAWVNDGNLIIRGTSADDSVAIFVLEPGVYSVVGENGTMLNGEVEGQLTTNPGEVYRDVKIDLRGGDDNLYIGNGLLAISQEEDGNGEQLAESDFPRDLKIKMGSGDDSVMLEGVSVARDTEIDTGDGFDEVFVTGEGPFGANWFGDDLKIDTGNHADLVVVAGGESLLFVKKELKIKTGSGDDTVSVDLVDLGRLSIDTGNDSDLVVVSSLPVDEGEEQNDFGTEQFTGELPTTVFVEGNVSIDTGSGNDGVGLGTAEVGGNVKISTKAGLDGIVVAQSFIAGDLQIKSGKHSDFVAVSAVEVGDDADIETDSGDDSVGLQGLLVSDEFELSTGDGNDTVNAAIPLVGLVEQVLDFADFAGLGLPDEVVEALPAILAPPEVGQGFLPSLGAREIEIETGSGSDWAALVDLAFTEEFELDLGKHNDTLLALTFILFGEEAEASGGSGRDALGDVDADVVVKRFEDVVIL